MKRAAPTARSVAAEVLVRVWKDAAFAAAALDVELDRAVQLEARDRGLATELVYGTLRHARWLESRIARYATRGTNALDPRVRAHLMLAAYQVLVLTRVPDFAAVSEAVSATRGLRGEKVAGFVNAVLRKIAAEPKPDATELARAALASADPWLAKAIRRSVGEDAALHLFGGGTHAPPLGLRVEDPSSRDAWIARLREARPDAEIIAGKISPLAILVRGAGRVVDLPGYDEGAWTPQEEGSQLVGLALGAQPGEVVLDACAGRGNKTGLLARRVGAGAARGAVDAADVHPQKLERLRTELARIGVAPRATYAVDWSAGSGEVAGLYDRVLVDAPCSGTGTMRRRPELLARFSDRDRKSLSEKAALQRAILSRCATLVKPGGHLVYAVCSVLREEAEDVIDVAAEVGLVPAPFDAQVQPEARALAGEGESTLRLLPKQPAGPERDGDDAEPDGYFVASFVRA